MTKPYDLEGECLSPIATPMADPQLVRLLLKTARKATRAKEVKRGVKEVVKSVRRGLKGLVILAGDVSPVDVLSHLPVLCEESLIPYVFIPSKTALGLFSATKRQTSCLMVCASPGSDYSKYYQEACRQVGSLNLVTRIPG